jgi:hypothetical protein
MPTEVSVGAMRLFWEMADALRAKGLDLSSAPNGLETAKELLVRAVHIERNLRNPPPEPKPVPNPSQDDDDDGDDKDTVLDGAGALLPQG